MQRRPLSIAVAISLLSLTFLSGRPAAAQSASPSPDSIAAARELVTASQSLAMGQKLGQEIGGELRNRMIEELRKRGHNI
jgi:hypothetical protein